MCVKSAERSERVIQQIRAPILRETRISFLPPVSREDTYKLVSHHCIHNLLFAGISPVFISVWLAEIIILTSLLVGGYYLYIRNTRTHTPGQSTHITHLHLLLSLH